MVPALQAGSACIHWRQARAGEDDLSNKSIVVKPVRVGESTQHVRKQQDVKAPDTWPPFKAQPTQIQVLAYCEALSPVLAYLWTFEPKAKAAAARPIRPPFIELG